MLQSLSEQRVLVLDQYPFFEASYSFCYSYIQPCRSVVSSLSSAEDSAEGVQAQRIAPTDVLGCWLVKWFQALPNELLSKQSASIDHWHFRGVYDKIVTVNFDLPRTQRRIYRYGRWLYKYTCVPLPLYRYTGNPNFGRFVLGCIEIDFFNWRLVLPDFSSFTTLARLRTAPG